MILTSCGDSDVYFPDKYTASLKAHYLRPNQTEFSSKSSKPSSFQLVVNSVETPWKFQIDSDWYRLSPDTGSATSDVTLSCDENFQGGVQRIGVFYLNSTDSEWEYSVPMSVIQAGASPAASVATSEITFSGAAGTKSVDVTSNCEYNISCSDSWLEVQKSEDGSKLSVSAVENASVTSRTSKIYLCYKDMSLTSITVTQQAANVTLDTQTLEFENTAADCTIKVTSEASWTAKTSQTWIQLNPESGSAGESSLKVSVSPNSSISSREGYIYFYIGSSQVVQIPVVQKGMYIEFSASSLTMEAGVDEKTISIRSNTSWTISTYPEWCSVSPTSGTGNANISVKTADNPNTSQREGVIKAIQPGISLETSMNIVQSGKTFDFGTGSIECSDLAQTINVSITSNGSWTASTADSWITVKPSSATGNGTLSITVTENNADDARTGKITLTIGDKSYEISVTQSGKYFTVKFENNDIGSRGGDVLIDVSSNDTWSAAVNGSPSWIKLSKTNGFGAASFTATVEDNPSVNSRSATIVLTTVHEKSVKIIVSQAARYLTVDHQDVLFFAKGGDSEDITISTDGSYSITKSALWFSISEKGNGVFVVTAEENTGKDAREATIVITETDLKEGTYSVTLPVIQTCYGGTFVLSGYGEDKNWDIGASANASFSVVCYSSDKNWDSSTYNVKFSVSVTGYKPDSNWDTSTSSNVSFGKGGFSSDSNYDSKTSSQGNLVKSGFGSDNNWDK